MENQCSSLSGQERSTSLQGIDFETGLKNRYQLHEIDLQHKMNNNGTSKKKKFVYRSVIGRQKNSYNDRISHFPDDLSSTVHSQPSKKPRLSLKEPVRTKAPSPSNDDYFRDIDFGDVENDFNEKDFAELDQIEIAASQQIPPRKNTKSLPPNLPKSDDMLDELLSFSPKKSKTLKPKTIVLPTASKSRKSTLNNTNVSSDCSLLSTNNNANTFKADVIYIDVSEEASNHAVHQNDLTNGSIEKSFQKQYNEAQVELSECKAKLEQFEQKFNSKDGEIKILRENLRKSSEDEYKLKVKVLSMENAIKSQQSETERNLLKEMERLKTQLEFKEKEVQDALHKLKQNASKPRQQVSKSPVSDNRNSENMFSDGFRDTNSRIGDQQQHQQMNRTILINQNNCKTASTNSSKAIESTSKSFSSGGNNRLKNCFMRNFRASTTSSKIMMKLSELSVDYTFSKHRADESHSCTHNSEEVNEHEGLVDTTTTDNNDLMLFVVELQNSIELVQEDGFFVTDFILRLEQRLKNLQTLFSCQKESTPPINEKTKQKFRNGSSSSVDASSCSQCNRLFEIGFKSLFVLKESCVVFDSVRKYLLEGFAVKQNVAQGGNTSKVWKQGETIDGVEFHYKYPNTKSSILVRGMEQVVLSEDDSSKTNKTFAVRLWQLLLSLRENKMWPVLLEDLFFEFCMELLTHPKQSAPTVSFLKYLAEKEMLSSYLNVSTVDRVLHVVQLLLNCSAMEEVSMILCTNSDRCPLLLVYNVLLSVDSEECDKMLLVFYKLVCLLLSLLAQEKMNAYDLLLNSTCHCCNDVLECLITFLFDEFKVFRKKIFHPLFEELQNEDRQRMTIFQSGMVLLCNLCSNDKHLNEKRSPVEWSYFNLLTGTIKIYHKIPWISENEVIAIEDLLDQDQFLEFDGTSNKGDGEIKDGEIGNDVNNELLDEEMEPT